MFYPFCHIYIKNQDIRGKKTIGIIQIFSKNSNILNHVLLNDLNLINVPRHISVNQFSICCG